MEPVRRMLEGRSKRRRLGSGGTARGRRSGSPGGACQHHPALEAAVEVEGGADGGAAQDEQAGGHVPAVTPAGGGLGMAAGGAGVGGLAAVRKLCAADFEAALVRVQPPCRDAAQAEVAQAEAAQAEAAQAR